MLIIDLPGSEQRLIFTNAVLSFISKYRQIKKGQSESGGQLFAKITPKIIIVAAASGPHWRDYSRRLVFFPNKRRLADEIQVFFKKGLHYVGDWHTHPQISPKPSWLDIFSMKSCFLLSCHELNYFLLVIVGQSKGSEGLWMGLINSSKIIYMQARV